MARDCPKPQAEKNKRPCFKCKKLGHLARDCRSSPAKLVESAEPGHHFLGCVTFAPLVDAEGFRQVTRPMPRQASVLDFISRAATPTKTANRFRVFTAADMDGKGTSSQGEVVTTADVARRSLPPAPAPELSKTFRAAVSPHTSPHTSLHTCHNHTCHHTGCSHTTATTSATTPPPLHTHAQNFHARNYVISQF